MKKIIQSIFSQKVFNQKKNRKSLFPRKVFRQKQVPRLSTEVQSRKESKK